LEFNQELELLVLGFEMGDLAPIALTSGLFFTALLLHLVGILAEFATVSGR
jgi:hypothetical protein